MAEKDVWKGKESVNIRMKPDKVPFNRYNLKKFYIANSNDLTKDYDEQDSISVEAFLDFFDRDSLSKKDEETGCYISHLICMDGYLIKRFEPILKYLLDNKIVSPYEINDKGQLFFDCMFQTKNYFNWWYINLNGYEYLIRYSINITNHQDFNGNNVAHHLIVNCPGTDYRSSCMWLDQELFEMKNKNGISALNLRELSEELWLSNYFFDKHFTIEETSSQIIIKTYIPKSYGKGREMIGKYINKDGDFRYLRDVNYDEKIHIYPKDEILLKLLEKDKYMDVREYFPKSWEMDDYGVGSMNVKEIIKIRKEKAKKRVKGKQ